MLKRLGGKQVLITGAASGIGRCLALEFASQGCLLSLLDLDERGLAEVTREAALLGVEARSHVADVTDRPRLEALSREISCDILVNCAGVSLMAEIEDTTPEDWDWVIGINLLGPVNCVRAFLPGMKEKAGAHVVNIASAAGLNALPTLAAYSATKFALVGFSEALAAECAPHGVKVTTVCPGTTRTPILNSRKKGFDGARVDRGLELLKPLVFTTPEKLASRIVSAVRKDRQIMTHTWLFTLLYHLKRLSPAAVYWTQRQAYRVAVRVLAAREAPCRTNA